MSHRSIFAGMTPTVIIKSGTSVTVEGWNSDQVAVETSARGGLKLERRRNPEPNHARPAVSDHASSNVHRKVPGSRRKDLSEEVEVIEVQIGSDGRVQIPLDSCVKIYAGVSVEVSNVQGSITVIAGGSVRVQDVRTLVYGSSGGDMDLECETIAGDEVKFEAGRDLRCCIRDLASARVFVNDQDGYREGVIGDGELTVRLKAGGYVTLVMDQIQAFNR